MKYSKEFLQKILTSGSTEQKILSGPESFMKNFCLALRRERKKLSLPCEICYKKEKEICYIILTPRMENFL